MEFGGTSGATPSTAGRAAHLIQYARQILDSPWTGVRDGALAIAGPCAQIPARGPLKDGRLTADELTRVLHHVAVPHEPESPARYLVEGYGELQTPAAINLAEKVLDGRAEEPSRPVEDQMHEAVESIRSVLINESVCA